MPMTSDTPYDQNYLKWKGWQTQKPFGHLKYYERCCFDGEIGRTRLHGIKNVLEIGFGNGGFLAYARQRRWNVTGTEESQELLAAGAAAGFKVLHAGKLAELPDESFDLIVAFDVFEHIRQEELAGFWGLLKTKLRVGGALLARFPNGDSPLGLPIQNGDLTHQTALGSKKVRQLASFSGLSVAFLGGEIIPVLCWHLPLALYGLVARPVRALLGLTIRLFFFPLKNFCLTSPNLIMVLKRGGDLPLVSGRGRTSRLLAKNAMQQKK